MDNEKVLIEIDILKKIKDEIQKKIDLLEEGLKQSVQPNKEDAVESCNSKDGYYKFLITTKNLNEHTAQNYFGHLRGIKKRLEKYEGFVISGEIYQITDVDTLKRIKDIMSSCKKLIEDNKRQHNAFTAAFNNYLYYVKNYYNSCNSNDSIISSDFVLDE